MMDFPLILKWDKKDRNIPDLPLQILETYLLKENDLDDFSVGEGVPGKKIKSKIKQLKPTTLMQYLSGSTEVPKKEKEEISEKAEDLARWRNLLIWGDNLYVLKALKGRFKNSIQLIYIDPPFYTGTNEYIDIPVGMGKDTIQQGPGPIKEIAYRNIWSETNPTFTFSQWFYERLVFMKDLLKETGFIAVRFDYHYAHYAKALLDYVFDESNFICEFLVRRINKPVSEKSLTQQNHLIVQTDSLLLYRKSEQGKFINSIKKVKRKNADPIEFESDDDNIWIDITGYEKAKKTLYPTENSISLLERVITLCSKPKDLVADFFCGSGTTVATAQALERRWIAVDIGKYSIDEMRKRMLLTATDSSFPFQVLNLEMYNKHLLYLKLQKPGSIIQQSQQEYYQFILQKIGAEYLDGFEHINGKKDDVFIHVGDVDSMISALEIQKVIEEVQKKNPNKPKVAIYGWDYLMEVNFFKNLFQNEQEVEVELKIIPERLLNSDEAEEPFYDLPFLAFNQIVDPTQKKITINFEKFRTNYPAGKLAGNADTGFDYIDFWAIDWDYNEKMLFRGRDYSFRKIGSGRKIVESAKTEISHQYDKPGSYTIVITIYDIFANETTEYFQIALK